MGNWGAVQWRTSGRQQRVHTLHTSVISPMVGELGYLSSSAHQPQLRAAPRQAVNSPPNMQLEKTPGQSNKGAQSKN